MLQPDAQAIYEANARAHDDYARTHDEAVPYLYRRSTRRFYWELLCEALGGEKVWAGSRVLEAGCGTGTYTDRALAHGARACHGIDLSPAMLARARAKYPDPRCHWEQASLEEYAAAHPGEFDLAYSFSFLHHLPRIEEGLACLTRLLRPGGVYAALHEIILPRALTPIEKLDEKLESVFGSAVNSPEHFGQRLWNALPGRLTGRRGPPAEPRRGPDLVDFQLNESFDLQKFAGADVEVRGYSYLSFPGLRHLSAPVNHRLLILRRPQDRTTLTP